MQEPIIVPHVSHDITKKKQITKGQCKRPAQIYKESHGNILTATSTKSFGRLILRIEPQKDLPSKESAAEASSGVKNSRRAWHFSLCICSEETVSNTNLYPT